VIIFPYVHSHHPHSINILIQLISSLLADLRKLEIEVLVTVLQSLVVQDESSPPPLSTAECDTRGSTLSQTDSPPRSRPLRFDDDTKDASATSWKSQHPNSLAKSDSTRDANNGGGGIRVLVTAEKLIVRLADDVPLQDTLRRYSMSSDPNIFQNKRNRGDDPQCVCMTIKSPCLESYPLQSTTATSSPLFSFGKIVKFSANDFSLFDMSIVQLNAGAGGGKWCSGARYGDGCHEVPILHKTSLRFEPDGKSRESTRSGVVIPDFFKLEITIEESNGRNLVQNRTSTQAKLAVKTITVQMSIHNVTFRFDPKSSWIHRLLHIFSAATTQPVQCRNSGAYTPATKSEQSVTVTPTKGYSDRESKRWDGSAGGVGRSSGSAMMTEEGDCDVEEVEEGKEQVRGPGQVFPPSSTPASLSSQTYAYDASNPRLRADTPYHADVTIASLGTRQIIRVSVVMHQLLVDYCCSLGEEAGPLRVQPDLPQQYCPVASRLLFSVGQLSISSHLISDSTEQKVSCVVREACLRLSNRVLKDSPYEQSPMDIFGVCKSSGERGSGRGDSFQASQGKNDFVNRNFKAAQDNQKTVSGNETLHIGGRAKPIGDGLTLQDFIDAHRFVVICALDTLSTVVSIPVRHNENTDANDSVHPGLRERSAREARTHVSPTTVAKLSAAAKLGELRLSACKDTLHLLSVSWTTHVPSRNIL